MTASDKQPYRRYTPPSKPVPPTMPPVQPIIIVNTNTNINNVGGRGRRGCLSTGSATGDAVFMLIALVVLVVAFAWEGLDDFSHHGPGGIAAVVVILIGITMILTGVVAGRHQKTPIAPAAPKIKHYHGNILHQHTGGEFPHEHNNDPDQES